MYKYQENYVVWMGQQMREKKIFNVGHSGFSAIEILVVVAIMGILSMSMYPAILNSMATRALENSAREIMGSLQSAKFQAIKTKLPHRVRFANDSGVWEYVVEREVTAGIWTRLPRFSLKMIPSAFSVDVKSGTADKTVEFSHMGFIVNFEAFPANTIVLESSKLRNYGQPDQRIINFYFGGSIRYEKTQSF